MLLTKECDYGVRIIRALSTDEKKTVEAICRAEYIPDKYAYKILKKLALAGFVRSLRGRDGGYQLSKTLDEFTIYDVVAAIDGNLFIFECLREDKYCPVKTNEGNCSVHLEFERLQTLLIDEMRAKTMREVLGLALEEPPGASPSI